VAAERASPTDPPDRPPARWWEAPGALAVLCVVAAVLAVVVHGWRADLPAAVLLAVVGVLIGVEDFARHRIPNALLGPTAIALTALLLAAAVATGAWGDLLRGGLAALACGAGFLVLALLRPTGLGMGDVKLAAVLGLWLGWLGWGAVVLGVLAGFVLGGVAGAVLLVSGRATRTTAIAFGPWLLLGAAVATVVAVRFAPVLTG